MKIGKAHRTQYSSIYSANTIGAPMHPAPIGVADRKRKKKNIGTLCLVSIAYWRRGTSVRQYIGGSMCPPPLLLADRTQKMHRNVRILSRQDKKNKKRRTEQFGALRLFSSQSPINLALQTANGNTLKKRRRPHKKLNRNYVLTVACFPTFLFFH
jgi:hypothetical protein